MEDPVTKAERYRKAANKYGEMAKQADEEYVAEVYRKVAVRCPGELAKPLRRACVRPARGRRLSAHDRQRRPLMVSENHSEAV
jgi:hypothetical protein